MKILIAGPLPNKKKSGGVAVFTENLAKEASNEGNSVLIATNNKAKLDIKGIETTSIFNIRRIKKFNADIIISSLQYSFFLSFYNLNCTKVHILHGFTNFKFYGIFKCNLMHFVDKLVRKKYDFVLANSKYTEYINNVIFNIKCDGYFYIGLSDEQLRFIKNESFQKRSNDLLYVGRLVSVKNVDKAIEAFNMLNNIDCKFEILGYGPEFKKLYNKYSSEYVCFRGPIKYQNVIRAYASAKVFISLNDAEPFGITYMEALASGMFIVAPNNGGQVEFLKKFPGRYQLVDINSKTSIMNAIKLGINSDISPLSEVELRSLSYKNTLNSIFSLTIKQRKVR